MKILVGCPVSGREWILPKWREHLDEAFARLATEVDDLDYEFIFALSEHDQETIELIQDWDVHFIYTGEPKGPEKASADWDESRYMNMTYVRNDLLWGVRDIEPDLFLSLDSDILLDPQALVSAYEVFGQHDADAVGLKCYMTGGKDRHYPNMVNSLGRLTRIDGQEITKVECLMAAKLMTPKAYNIDYSYNERGEDFGWSLNAKDAGCNFYWDGRVTNKHVMSREMLDLVDSRLGW